MTLTVATLVLYCTLFLLSAVRNRNYWKKQNNPPQSMLQTNALLLPLRGILMRNVWERQLKIARETAENLELARARRVRDNVRSARAATRVRAQIDSAGIHEIRTCQSAQTRSQTLENILLRAGIPSRG